MKSSTPSKNPVTDDTLSPTLVDPSLVTVMGSWMVRALPGLLI